METRSLPPPWMTSRHTPTQQFQFPLQQSLQNQLPLFAKSLLPICVHPKPWRAPPPVRRGPLLRSPPALFLTAQELYCGEVMEQTLCLGSLPTRLALGRPCTAPSCEQSQPRVLVPETPRRRSQIGGGPGSAGHLTRSPVSGAR